MKYNIKRKLFDTQTYFTPLLLSCFLVFDYPWSSVLYLRQVDWYELKLNVRKMFEYYQIPFICHVVSVMKHLDIQTQLSPLCVHFIHSEQGTNENVLLSLAEAWKSWVTSSLNRSQINSFRTPWKISLRNSSQFSTSDDEWFYLLQLPFQIQVTVLQASTEILHVYY
jgi:hypothetical protein